MALVSSRVMKGHIVTSQAQDKVSVQVVFPIGEFKALCALVDLGCQAVTLANQNVFGDQISEKYDSSNGGTYFEPTTRRLRRLGRSQ